MILVLKSKTRNWFARQRVVLNPSRSTLSPLRRVVGRTPLPRGEDRLPGRYPFHYRQGGFRFSRGLQKRVESRTGLDRFPPPPFRRVGARGPLPPPAPTRLRREGMLSTPLLLHPPSLPLPPLFGYRRLRPVRIRRGRGGYPIYRSRPGRWVKPKKRSRKGWRRRRVIIGRGRRRRIRILRWYRFRAGWIGRWLGVRLFISNKRGVLGQLPPFPRRRRRHSRRRRRRGRKGLTIYQYQTLFRFLCKTVRAVYASPLLPRSIPPLLLSLCRTLSSRLAVLPLSIHQRLVVRRLIRAASTLLRFRPPLPPPSSPFRLKRGVLRFRPPLLPPSSLLPLLPHPDRVVPRSFIKSRGGAGGLQRRPRLRSIRYRPYPQGVVRLRRQLRSVVRRRRRLHLASRWRRWSGRERRVFSALLSYSEYEHAST